MKITLAVFILSKHNKTQLLYNINSIILFNISNLKYNKYIYIVHIFCSKLHYIIKIYYNTCVYQKLIYTQ